MWKSKTKKNIIENQKSKIKNNNRKNCRQVFNFLNWAIPVNTVTVTKKWQVLLIHNVEANQFPTHMKIWKYEKILFANIRISHSPNKQWFSQFSYVPWNIIRENHILNLIRKRYYEKKYSKRYTRKRYVWKHFLQGLFYSCINRF